MNAFVLFVPFCGYLLTASQINFAETLTEIVKARNGPKSCVAGMLVMKRPGMDV